MTIRAMVVFENASNLPEDRFVNTFWFGGTLDETAASAIQGALTNFYNAANGGTAVGAWISSYVRRSPADSTQIRMYNMADAEPRPPTVRTFDLVAPLSAGNLPNEVAVTLSFYSGRNVPRQRGRIYLGPLVDDASQAGTKDQQVEIGVRTSLAAAAEALMDAAGPPWVVHSEAAGTDLAVSAGWVDNAFDTQRRRGGSSTLRTTWPV